MKCEYCKKPLMMIHSQRVDKSTYPHSITVYAFYVCPPCVTQDRKAVWPINHVFSEDNFTSEQALPLPGLKMESLEAENIRKGKEANEAWERYQKEKIEIEKTPDKKIKNTLGDAQENIFDRESAKVPETAALPVVSLFMGKMKAVSQMLLDRHTKVSNFSAMLMSFLIRQKKVQEDMSLQMPKDVRNKYGWHIDMLEMLKMSVPSYKPQDELELRLKEAFMILVDGGSFLAKFFDGEEDGRGS